MKKFIERIRRAAQRIQEWIDKLRGKEPDEPEPTNPSIPPSPSNAPRMQQWYFTYKSYDNTFRVRWPTYFYTEHNVGQGSYTMINGNRAVFRNHWVDDGRSTRPSYTLPGPASRLSGRVTCVLHDKNGNALAWFQTSASGTTSGRLP